MSSPSGKSTSLAIRIFKFFNEQILRNSKESTVNMVGVFNILGANIKHDVKASLGFPLKLEYPNKTLQFPLPNRWSNPDISKAKQQLYMVIKTVMINLKQAEQKQKKLIDSDPDRSRGAISAMKFFGTLHRNQMKNIINISQKYSTLSQPEYIPERQLLFADSLVNGQVSYMLRKFDCSYYELPESQSIEDAYRSQFIYDLQKEEWNDNCAKFQLSKEQIIQRVRNNDGVYTMLYEHLEKRSEGNVIHHTQTLYMKNAQLGQEHFMHVPYPIFLRVTHQGSLGFICIGVGIRFNGRPKIFSPFFKNQDERVWRLVQSHVAQIAINDFSVRTHLGIYHFTTNQYHVPIYNTLNRIGEPRQKANLSEFIDHSYGMFSRGLQGVNVSATASLVNPNEDYSLVNKALNITQNDSIAIIAETSNNIKIFDFNPRSLLKNNRISEQQVHQLFPKMKFDCELYDILAEYIAGVYDAFEVKDVQKLLFKEINDQTEYMAVGKGNKARPVLNTHEDVLRTIQNLCFIWVGFHSHTFSVISTANYYALRPSMLKSAIPEKSQEWSHLTLGEELPHAKVMMETGKLNQGTTQRDSDNFLMDNIIRQADSASYNAWRYQHEKNFDKAEQYRKLQKVAVSTVQKLHEYQQRILKVNRQRLTRAALSFEWMVPSRIQSSLNI